LPDYTHVYARTLHYGSFRSRGSHTLAVTGYITRLRLRLPHPHFAVHYHTRVTTFATLLTVWLPARFLLHTVTHTLLHYTLVACLRLLYVTAFPVCTGLPARLVLRFTTLLPVYTALRFYVTTATAVYTATTLRLVWLRSRCTDVHTRLRCVALHTHDAVTVCPFWRSLVATHWVTYWSVTFLTHTPVAVTRHTPPRPFTHCTPAPTVPRSPVPRHRLPDLPGCPVALPRTVILPILLHTFTRLRHRRLRSFHVHTIGYLVVAVYGLFHCRSVVYTRRWFDLPVPHVPVVVYVVGYTVYGLRVVHRSFAVVDVWCYCTVPHVVLYRTLHTHLLRITDRLCTLFPLVTFGLFHTRLPHSLRLHFDSTAFTFGYTFTGLRSRLLRLFAYHTTHPTAHGCGLVTHPDLTVTVATGFVRSVHRVRYTTFTFVYTLLRCHTTRSPVAVTTFTRLPHVYLPFTVAFTFCTFTHSAVVPRSRLLDLPRFTHTRVRTYICTVGSAFCTTHTHFTYGYYTRTGCYPRLPHTDVYLRITDYAHIRLPTPVGARYTVTFCTHTDTFTFTRSLRLPFTTRTFYIALRFTPGCVLRYHPPHRVVTCHTTPHVACCWFDDLPFG